MFRDRIDAANQLAEKLKNENLDNAIVLAIPRGGVEIGYALAQKLNLPLDVIFIKKIGHPLNKELAIGAVSQYGRTIDESFNISEDYLKTETSRVKELLDLRQRQYSGNRVPIPLNNKTVILTDDGIATGHTMFSAIEVVKAHQPLKIIVAVPVASPRTIQILKQQTDVVICEVCPEEFHSVGQFYQKFDQISDEQAVKYLTKANKAHVET